MLIFLLVRDDAEQLLRLVLGECNISERGLEAVSIRE
jgi:hypothetical protein